LNFECVIPACVTPFASDGEVDYKNLEAHGAWLASMDGITGILCNGHAGEGLAMSDDERNEVIRCLVKAVGGRVPIIAGIVSEGTRGAAAEAKRAAKAGASGLLVYPSHSWLRFGYQKGAPQDRYAAIAQASGLPLVLFLYPDVTKATYDLNTLRELCANPAVVAIKDGVRNMSRWDTETPALRKAFPRLKIVTCPELMVELMRAAQTHDYDAAKKVYDRTLALTSGLYHIEPHVAATVALKTALVLRGLLPSATVRSPLMPLTAAQIAKIRTGLEAAGIPIAPGK